MFDLLLITIRENRNGHATGRVAAELGNSALFDSENGSADALVLPRCCADPGRGDGQRGRVMVVALEEATGGLAQARFRSLSYARYGELVGSDHSSRSILAKGSLLPLLSLSLLPPVASGARKAEI